jgi:hypothetical protein
VYAKVGTQAHAVLEHANRNNGKLNPDLLPPDDGGDMANAVTVALIGIAEEKRRFAKIELIDFELKVKPLRFRGDCYGTSDIVIVGTYPDGKRVVTIADYKHGAGVPVAASTPQMLIYALGAADMVGGRIDEFRTVVIQPRVKKLAPIRAVDHAPEAMIHFSKHLASACQATDSPEAPLVPDQKGCRWCPAKSICPKTGSLRAVDPDFAAMIESV